jgi:hypothetical protein
MRVTCYEIIKKTRVKLQNFYYSPNIIRVIKLGSRLEEASNEDMRTTVTFLSGKFVGKRPLGKVLCTEERIILKQIIKK